AIGANTLDTTEWANLDGLNQTLATTSSPTFNALTVTSCTGCSPTTSAALAAAITDETGSGALVFANTPTLVTPTLGVATATTINKVTITTPATGSTLTIADGKTLTASNTLTFTGTDSSSVAFGTGGTVAYTANNLSVFAATTSLQLLGVMSDETGSGALVFANTPTLVTPVLGAATGTSLALGGGTALTTTNQTGTGSLVLATSPSITTPTISGGTHTGLTSLGIRSTGTGALDLTIANTENLTAGRTLTITTGDAARTITLSGNPTLNDWFDQSVKVAASPTFAGATFSSDLVFSANSVIRRNTSDGSDNGWVRMEGGGASGSSRGSLVEVNGNESASPGYVVLRPGAVTGGSVRIIRSDSGLWYFVMEDSDGSATFTSSKAGQSAWTMNSTDANGSSLIITTSGNTVFKIGSTKAIDNTGTATTGGFVAVTWPTSGAAANAVLGDGDYLRRSTSSRRWKQDITYLTLDDVKDVVMGLRPVTYRGIGDKDSKRLWPGFIAEDVAEIEPLLATYDDGIMGGLPNYVTYDRIPAYLVPVIQDHESRLSLVESSLGLAVDNDNDGITLSNIKDIASISGKWSIDENGELIAQVVTVETGFNMKDQITGEYFCVTIKNGEFDKQAGKCGTQESGITNQESGNVAGESTDNTSNSELNSESQDGDPESPNQDADVSGMGQASSGLQEEEPSPEPEAQPDEESSSEPQPEPESAPEPAPEPSEEATP
ncbi:MAG: tail fiber domain-containing protein, partial [Candidatus Doudnabacteria bacterium]|nr:tail fiber domain-containing protein [Candidatus Doudnabacteria bacterium]